MLKRFRKVYPKLNPGDCLIHNTMVAHGSEPNKSNSPRKGITLRYVPKSLNLINHTKINIYKV